MNVKSMNDCIFCKIADKTIPSMTVYEDKNTLVFMDTAMDVDGHILVIPRVHAKNILDCDEETLSHLMSTVKKISRHLVNSCGYEGVNLLNASGESAGQSVDHFHIHIVPRKKGDNIDAWPHFNGAEHDTKEMFRKLVIK